MSLTGNTEKLNSLIAAINALPDAGSGGGGATVETCTVTVTVESESPEDITLYVTYVDANSGTAVVEEVAAPMLDVVTKTISVAKNSLITVDQFGRVMKSISVDNMQIIRNIVYGTSNSVQGVVLQITGDGATLGYLA